MTEEDFYQYWRPAREKICLHTPYRGRHKDTHASMRLAQLFDVPYPQECSWANIALNDDMKFHLQAIAGPHSQTIVLMLEIKKKYGAVA